MVRVDTPGTQPGRVIEGTYTQSGAPYAATTLEGQQAGHMLPWAVRELRFVVEALLKMDPNPEQVVFDTVLELASGDYSVKGVGGA